jgi:hypothetical protein
VCKRFIKLVDFDKKTGSDVAGQIKRFLEECDLELPFCRGQGYDSTSKMSGEFEGGKNKNFGRKCLSLFLIMQRSRVKPLWHPCCRDRCGGKTLFWKCVETL